MIEMFYLMVGFSSYSGAIVPEKYTKEQCEKAGANIIANEYKRFACIPAPKQDVPVTSFSLNPNCIMIATNPPKLECKP